MGVAVPRAVALHQREEKRPALQQAPVISSGSSWRCWRGQQVLWSPRGGACGVPEEAKPRSCWLDVTPDSPSLNKRQGYGLC